MIKVILFDCDGPIIKRDKYFSQRLAELSDLSVDKEREKQFFEGIFLQCEVGKADLKQILPDYFSIWGWEKSAEELLTFWFEGERTKDLAMIEYVKNLRKKGVLCYLATNNERYRAEYLWDNVGLKDVLDGLFSSCYLGYMKPEVEYWSQVYKNFSHIPKDEILVWDDKRNAVDSASGFGFKAECYLDFEAFKQTMQKYQLF